MYFNFRLLFFSFIIFSLGSFSQNRVIKEINNVKDFFQALDDNTEIHIQSDTLDFSINNIKRSAKITQYNIFELPNYRNIKNKTFFIEGDNLVLNGFNNLKIVGTKTKTNIISYDSSQDILTFKKSNNISLENLAIWHKEENCTGLVFSLVFSNNVKLNRCDLNGSGAIGANLIGSDKVLFKNVNVFNNAFHGIYSFNSTRVKFINSNIYKNNTFFEEEDLIFSQFSDLSFENCQFYENMSSQLFNDSFYVYSDLDFQPYTPTFINCTFESNSFDEPKPTKIKDYPFLKKRVIIDFFVEKMVSTINSTFWRHYNSVFSPYELSSFFSKESTKSREDFTNYFYVLYSKLYKKKLVLKNVNLKDENTYLIRLLSQKDKKELEWLIKINDEGDILLFKDNTL